jgi:hypothetical protein
MNKENLEFAVAELKDKGVDAKIRYNTVYVVINGYELELAEVEILFRAHEWRKKQKENHE